MIYVIINVYSCEYVNICVSNADTRAFMSLPYCQMVFILISVSGKKTLRKTVVPGLGVPKQRLGIPKRLGLPKPSLGVPKPRLG